MLNYKETKFIVMKQTNKIIIASIAASAIATYFVMRQRKKMIPRSAPMLTKRVGNEEKHITNVFSKSKTPLHKQEIISD